MKMTDFGCVYNPRPPPGRCTKDIRNINVDIGCEKVDDRCKLRTNLSSSVQTKPFNPEGFKLSGIKDVDYGILNLLSDDELVTLCRVDSNANKYCTNQDYWENRVRHLFPYVHPTILNEGRNGRSWSDYYIQDLRSQNYEDMMIKGLATGRRDLQMIADHNGLNDIEYEHMVNLAEQAATYGNVERLQYLKEIGLDLHRNNGGLMNLAAQNGQYFVVKYLIEDGADVVGMPGFLALQSSIRNGHYNIRDLLKQYGASTNPPTTNVRVANGELHFV